MVEKKTPNTIKITESTNDPRSVPYTMKVHIEYGNAVMRMNGLNGSFALTKPQMKKLGNWLLEKSK